MAPHTETEEGYNSSSSLSPLLLFLLVLSSFYLFVRLNQTPLFTSAFDRRSRPRDRRSHPHEQAGSDIPPRVSFFCLHFRTLFPLQMLHHHLCVTIFRQIVIVPEEIETSNM